MTDNPGLSQAFRCRCVWLDRRCANKATQEDGLCDWCAKPGARTEEQYRENPKALVGPGGEYLGLGGAGELHDAPLAEQRCPDGSKGWACWYENSGRTLCGALVDEPDTELHTEWHLGEEGEEA